MRQVLPLLGAACAALFLSATSSAQQVPANWSTSTAYTGGGLIRASDGNYYRCLKNNMNHNPITDGHIYWELYYVRANTTLKVSKATGARFSSLKPAWAMCSSAMIVPAAQVTILIDALATPYTETFSGPFNLDAESGERISLYANNPKFTLMTFTGSDNAFVLDSGHKMGQIANLTIDGSGTGSNGFLVDTGSELLNSINNTAQNFTNGFVVDHHSGMVMTNSNAINCSGEGFVADHMSHLDCSHAYVTSSTHESVGIGAFNGSEVDADNSNVLSAQAAGYEADYHATLSAKQAIAASCHDGFDAFHWSEITAINSTANNNSNFGYSGNMGGHIDAMGATTNMNGTDFGVPPNTSATDQTYIAH